MRTHGKFFVAVCIVVSSCAKERTTETVDETKALKASITANQPQWNVAMTFVHPGITWNASDLAFMKSHRTTAPWKASYDLFAASSTASLTYTMQGPFAVVGREPNVNLSAYQNDMAAVLHQSIMWYMTNNATYANKAKQILLAWAGTHNTWSGSTSALAASDYGVQGVTGAEILRHTSCGLTAANVTVIENYFRNVINARLLDEGGTPAQGNQGAARLKCRIACTIFYNDEATYNTVINRFTAGTGDCISLARNSLWNASANGAQQQKVAEISPIHSVISLIWGSCPNSEQQETDLFGHWGNRLMWTLEYWAKYNLGNSVPYTTFGPCAQSWSTIGANGRSTTINWALTDMFYEAYVVKKGLSAPYTVQYRNQQTLTVNTWYFRR